MIVVSSQIGTMDITMSISDENDEFTVPDIEALFTKFVKAIGFPEHHVQLIEDKELGLSTKVPQSFIDTINKAKEEMR